MPTMRLRKWSLCTISAVLWNASFAWPAHSQTQPTVPSQTDPAALAVNSSPQTTVPRVLKFSGVLKDPMGQPRTGAIGVTFALYEDEEGGAPLWLETQNVQADDQGRYTVVLGATKSEGLPVDLFTQGKARWLGVQVQLPGEVEQRRAIFISVPYALKAYEAETLGGRPASDFVLAGDLKSAQTTEIINSPASNPLQLTITPLAQPTPTTGASTPTANFAGLSVSNTFQSTPPGTPIPQILNTVNVATASSGSNSNPLDLIASAFNSSTGLPQPLLFRWQVEPLGNNTAAPDGQLNLLFASGNSAPTETGFSIGSNGTIDFTGDQSVNGSISIADPPASTLPGTNAVPTSLLNMLDSTGASRVSIDATGLVNLAGPNSAGVSSALQFNTASSLPHGPWFLTTSNGGTDGHDHPLLATYNCRWNDNTQSFSRITDGEHCVRIGYETRWTLGDPTKQRGGFEFNIDIANQLSGIPYFDRRPFYLVYDMDQAQTRFAVGDTRDSQSDYFSVGFLQSYSAVLVNGRPGGLPALVIGPNAQTVFTQPATGRLIVTDALGYSPTDRAAYVWLGQPLGQGLALEPGMDTSNAFGEIFMGYQRPTAVNIGGFLTFGSGDSISNASAKSGLIRLPNNQGLTARSAGGGRDIPLLKINGSDQVEIGSSLLVKGDLSITGRLHSDNGDLQHARIQTGPIPPHASGDVTVNWTKSFPDTNYTATCTVVENAGNNEGLRVQHIESVAANQITVRVINDDKESSDTATLDCIGLHD
jgi:hypothetical protein